MTSTTQGWRKWTRIHVYPHSGLWAFALTLLAVNSIWLSASTRVSVTPRFALVCGVSTFISVALTLVRRVGGDTFDSIMHRAWCFLMMLALTALFAEGFSTINHLLMTLSFPLADELLLRWDHSLGLNWLAYAKAIASRPALGNTLSFAYTRLSNDGLAVILGLAVLLNRQLRVLEITFLVVTTSLVCLLVSPLFPARAAFATLADPELLSLVSQGGDYHLSQFVALRDTEPVLLRSGELTGLSTFPSFHTVLALLIMWCSRGHILAHVPAIGSGIAILAATPVYGGHYFVDLLAGACVAVGFIAAWECWLVRHARCYVAASTPRDPYRIGPKRALPAHQHRTSQRSESSGLAQAQDVTRLG